MADDKKPEAVAPTPPPAPPVVLAVIEPNDLFDLSSIGLRSVTREGVQYSRSEADRILMLARKYNVLVVEK